MDAEQLAELRRRAEAATPGPWATEHYHDFTTREHAEIYAELLEQGLYDQAGRRPLVEYVETMIDGTHRTICITGNGPAGAANAAFIKAADPSSILSLIAHAECQRAAIVEAQRLLVDKWWPADDPPINDGEYLTWATRWRYGQRRAPEHKIMGYSEDDGWTNPDDTANEHASFEVLSWRPLPAPPDDQL